MNLDRVFRKYYRPNGNIPRGLAVARINFKFKQIEFGFALSSEKDPFSYNKAKLIADNRMNSRKFTVPLENLSLIDNFEFKKKKRQNDPIRTSQYTLDDMFSKLVGEIQFVINEARQYAEYLKSKNVLS